MNTLPNLTPILPEIILALGAMAWLMLGVIKRDSDTYDIASNLSVLTIFGAMAVMISNGTDHVVTMNGMFVMDAFAVFMKLLVLIGSATAILMAGPYLKSKGIQSFEFPVLILLATLGMMMMISSNDFMALYLGLELQSLSLYVLAAFARDRQRATEAGLKYFVLGALSSGMLLYGISLVYGFAGNISFEVLSTGITDGSNIGVVVGMVFILSGLSFKISAVPFHMWTPDVYEGSPTPVTGFFAAAPKIAAMALFIRVIYDAFPNLINEWQQIIIFISIASMLIGAFVALVQTNIKRLMAYSSIGHVGYALIGIAAGTEQGIQAVLIYMAIYLTMTVGSFSIILSMRTKNGQTEDIKDLAGLAKTRPYLAFGLAVFMFSLAGIPMLAGFFGKLYIFLAAVEAGLFSLAVLGVVASVVGAVYYLKIIKVMYMDEPKVEFVKEASNKSMTALTFVTATINTPVSFLLISPLVAWAGVAAASLF
jgi:NADH-quinone oxidoreductase subunit N